MQNFSVQSQGTSANEDLAAVLTTDDGHRCAESILLTYKTHDTL